MHEIVFVAQKVILRLLFPINVTLLLGIAGLILWRRRALSFLLLLTSILWLLVMSLPLTGLWLLAPLESQAGTYADPKELSARGVQYIVVLSGDFRDGNLTPADKLDSSVLRLIEGVRLWRGVPGSRLVVTGGTIPGLSHDTSIAQVLSDMAREMAVPAEAIILEDKSWTTEDQAHMVAPIVEKCMFALVTSAFHMRRSILNFRQLGLNPIPAPCDFLTQKILIHYDTLMPRPRGLHMTEIATKEYIAAWWLSLKTKLSWN
ncbi:MAG: YdcF family protein [Desulfomonilaceae bacterium]